MDADSSGALCASGHGVVAVRPHRQLDPAAMSAVQRGGPR